MGFMFLKISAISRAKGHNALNKAAYISRDRLIDQRTGDIFDHRDRADLVHAEIKTPNQNPTHPTWVRQREALWNAVEQHETRVNARTARELVISLPHELSETARYDAASQFAQGVANRYGVAADLAIHQPPVNGDPRNHHAHILLTPRVITPEGFGAIARLYEPSLSLEAPKRMHFLKEVQQLRVWWAQTANHEYIKAGLAERLEALTPRYRAWLLEHRPHDTRLSADHSIDTETVAMKNDQKAIAAYWAYRRAQLNPKEQPQRELVIQPPTHQQQLGHDNDFSL